MHWYSILLYSFKNIYRIYQKPFGTLKSNPLNLDSTPNPFDSTPRSILLNTI